MGQIQTAHWVSFIPPVTALNHAGNQAVSPDMVKTFAREARQRMRLENGDYRREHLRALAQRVEVTDKEVRTMGNEVRTPAHLCRRFRRKINRIWSSEFCSEVAHPKRLELLTPRFVVWCSIQLSYGC